MGGRLKVHDFGAARPGPAATVVFLVELHHRRGVGPRLVATGRLVHQFPHTTRESKHDAPAQKTPAYDTWGCSRGFELV